MNRKEHKQHKQHEMNYLVIYEKTGNGWGAYVPDIPGLGVVSKSLDEVKRTIRERIEMHVEGLRAGGQRVPEPLAESDYIAISA